MTHYNSGLDICSSSQPLNLSYGEGVFGPKVEVRKLDDIRQSLKDPQCNGPDQLYAIAMDVGREEDREAIISRHLLYGVVTYSAGQVGDEPVRSQGHIHKRSPRNGWSTPEVYEIWSGKAVILMQEQASDDPGRCFAIEAGPGEVVVVPPFWAHATISAEPSAPLTFGAWCDRAYGFEYQEVRAHGGLAWFPILENQKLSWQANPAYHPSELITSSPRIYHELGIETGISLYDQFRKNPDRFFFVPDPMNVEAVWSDFSPC